MSDITDASVTQSAETYWSRGYWQSTFEESSCQYWMKSTSGPSSDRLTGLAVAEQSGYQARSDGFIEGVLDDSLDVG